METEPDQKDVDPLILSAHAAAEEPEESAHGDPIEEDVVEDSKEADEAPPFNMLRFLQDAQADRAVPAPLAAQPTNSGFPELPKNWSEMTPSQRRRWRRVHR